MVCQARKVLVKGAGCTGRYAEHSRGNYIAAGMRGKEVLSGYHSSTVGRLLWNPWNGFSRST